MITEKPSKTFSLSGNSKYSNFNTLNLNGQAQYQIYDNLGISLYGERYSSDGFYGDGDNVKVEKTAPKFLNLTSNIELFYNYSEYNEAIVRFKYHTENQKNAFLVNDNKDIVNDNVNIFEIANSLTVKHKFDNTNTLTGKVFYTYFDTEINDRYENTDAYYDSRPYNEKLFKVETQFDKVMEGGSVLTASCGYQYNQANTNRVDGGSKSTDLLFYYVQHDLQMSEQVNFITSCRVDAHSEYPLHFSPKAAISWKSS